MEAEKPRRTLEQQHSLTVDVPDRQTMITIPIVISNEDDEEEELDVCDVDLLEFQKKRSTPSFRLSSVNHDEEE